MSTWATIFKPGWRDALTSALVALVAIVALAPVPGAQAALDVPQGILYQGRLTDANRITVDDDSYDMYFTIWNSSDSGDTDCGANNLYVSGGTCAVPVTTAVTVTDGVFSVMLGSDTAAFDDDLFDDDSSTEFWLEVNIEGERLLPRRQIGATAFALQAGDSHLLDDKAASATGCTGECIPATDGNGNLLITGDPTGTGIGDGSLYVNPAAPGADETIFGVANNGSGVFVVDSAGDAALAGGLEIGDTLDVDGSSFTTDSAIDIYSLDSLTTGTGITVESNSADTSSRWLVDIINNNALATGTSNLGLENQSASAPFITMYDGTDQFGIYNWQGDPDGNITADTGSLALDTSTGALYVKTSDGDSGNWDEVGSGGGGTTLYSGDDSLAGDRTVALDGNTLTFSPAGGEDITIDASGNLDVTSELTVDGNATLGSLTGDTLNLNYSNIDNGSDVVWSLADGSVNGLVISDTGGTDILNVTTTDGQESVAIQSTIDADNIVAFTADAIVDSGERAAAGIFTATLEDDADGDDSTAILVLQGTQNSDDDESLVGLNILDLAGTPDDGFEAAIVVGEGWDVGLSMNRSSAGTWMTFNDGTDNILIMNVNGDPEGVESATTGSLAIDSSNGALYIKTSDVAADDWEELTNVYIADGTLTGNRTITMDGNTLTFAGDSADVEIDDGDITVGGNDLTFGNNETISNNLDDYLDVNAHFMPNNDNAYDLGTSAVRWRDLYLGPASLHIGTDGNDGSIGFNTGTSTFEFDQDILSKNPLVVTGEPTADTPAGAALSVNPVSPDPDEYIFSAANNGANVLRVDAEGDVVIDGTLQMNGDWWNTGETSLGDGSEDNINLNGVINTSILASGDNSFSLGGDTNRWQQIYVNSNEGIHIGDSDGDTNGTESTIGLNGEDLEFTSDDGFIFNVDDDNPGEGAVYIDDNGEGLLTVSRDGTHGDAGLYRGSLVSLTNDGAFSDDTSGFHSVVNRSGTVTDSTNSQVAVRGAYIQVTADHDVQTEGVWVDNKGLDVQVNGDAHNSGGGEGVKQEVNTGINIAVDSNTSRGQVFGLRIDVDSDIDDKGGDNEEFEAAIAITRGGIWIEGDDNTTLDQSSQVTDMGETGTLFVGSDVEVHDGGLCVGSAANPCDGALTEGRIYSIDSTVLTHDLAEMFPSTQTLMAGDIVSVSSDGDEHVERSTSERTIIGAISTDPGLILGHETEEDGYYPVALAGRVPIKVNNENGPLTIGDRIAVSSVTGVGMRAEGPGEVVGIAMQAATFANGSTDAIIAFVQPHRWDGVEDFDMSVTEDEPSSSVDTNAAFSFDGGDITNISTLSANDWSVDASGNFVTEGTYTVAVESSQNELVETYAVLGMEHYITLAGTADVSSGAARVLFENVDTDFNNIVDGSAPIFVTATPSNGSGSVFVQDKDSSGFRIYIDDDGTATEVDWMVMAYRRNYAPDEPEEEEEQEEEELVEEESSEPSEEEEQEEVGEEVEETSDPDAESTVETETDPEEVVSEEEEGETLEEVDAETLPAEEEPIPEPEEGPVEDEEEATEPESEEEVVEETPDIEEEPSEPAEEVSEEAPTDV